MKRLIALMLALAMAFSFCACGSGKNDEKFMKNIQKGLEARWKANDSSPSQYASPSEEEEYAIKFAQAELNAIGDLSEYTFRVKELADLAEQYVAALNSQVEGARYKSININTYNDLYLQKGYYARAVIICKLVELYGLKVSSNYTARLNEMMFVGNTYSALKAILASKITLEALGSPNYELYIENVSKQNLTQITALLNCYDEKGVLVDNPQVFLNNWASGSKNRETVICIKEFSRVELALEYNGMTGKITTEYVPVEYINNMTIDISLTSALPTEISNHSYNGDVSSICVIDDFSYETATWINGKASVLMKIAGVSTYSDGNNFMQYCNVGWKLYNQDNSVVDSGMFMVNQVSVGERFIDIQNYAKNLSPGSYRLELFEGR